MMNAGRCNREGAWSSDTCWDTSGCPQAAAAPAAVFFTVAVFHCEPLFLPARASKHTQANPADLPNNLSVSKA